jgi:hypothetical protein
MAWAYVSRSARERPEIKLLLMSGTHGGADGIPFLQKPFGVEELKEKMRQLLRSRQSTGFSQSSGVPI